MPIQSRIGGSTYTALCLSYVNVPSVTARVGLVGGAIYWTVEKGLWSASNRDGAKALTEFRENVIPTTNELIKQVPRGPQVTEAMKTRWNSGVEWTADGIANLPAKVTKCTKDGVGYVVDSVQSRRSK